MIVELSHRKRRGEPVVSAILHHHGYRDSETSIDFNSYIHFDQVTDSPPYPGTYIIQATLADGFTTWGKFEIPEGSK